MALQRPLDPRPPVAGRQIKAASPGCPGLAVNEGSCLSAARFAASCVAAFSLSDDGQMLLLERFDVGLHAADRVERHGFEDLAALAGFWGRDLPSDRKYPRRYPLVAQLLRPLQQPSDNQHRFFMQMAFSAVVRNGDDRLKNSGLLYRNDRALWFAPRVDPVTTSICPYPQYLSAPQREDHRPAFKRFAGQHPSRAQPPTEMLGDFGRRVCGVSQAARVRHAIAQSRSQTPRAAKGDSRMPPPLLAQTQTAWQGGLRYLG